MCAEWGSHLPIVHALRLPEPTKKPKSEGKSTIGFVLGRVLQLAALVTGWVTARETNMSDLAGPFLGQDVTLERNPLH